MRSVMLIFVSFLWFLYLGERLCLFTLLCRQLPLPLECGPHWRRQIDHPIRAVGLGRVEFAADPSLANENL